MRVLTAGAPPAAATIERVEGELGWEITQVYGLTETAPFITICEPRPEHAMLSPQARATLKARQGVELITSGELLVMDEQGTRELFTVDINAQGLYVIDLVPARYLINLKRTGIDRTSDLPKVVEIQANSVTTLNVSIDTGLR